ncbi:MAG: fibronectin type III domain-containing protein [Minisyncoccia bacterium]
MTAPMRKMVKSLAFSTPALALVLMGSLTAHAAGTTTSATSTASSTVAEPVISNVTATSTDTSALITWMTDEPATSEVAFGTSSAYSASTTPDLSFTTTHAVTLPNLMPSTLYHFSARSSDAGGSNRTSSIDQTFMTAASSSAATTTSPGSTSTSTATSSKAYLSLSAYSAAPGARVTAFGSGFTPLETVWLSFASSTSASSSQSMASSTASTTLGSATADQNGAFSFPFPVPNIPRVTLHLWASGATSGLIATNTLYIEPMSTSTGTSTPPTASPTPSIALSASSGMPGDVVTASGTGFTPLEGIAFAFGTTTSSTSADTNGNFSTPLTVPMGSGQVNVGATGLTSGFTASTTFYIEPESTSTGTSTATSTSITTLQNEITQLQNELSTLQNEVSTLQSQVQSLLSGTSTGTSTGAGNPPPPPTTTGEIDQNGQTVNTGSGIDFGGHNFGSQEHVQVMLNGSQVGQAFTNTAGSFSTGSMSLPTTPGTYTFTFIGQNSGITVNATITVK